MHHLAGPQLAAPAQSGAVQQIAMALAEGVVHLGHHRRQRAVGAVGVPEAHGLEGVAPHARQGVQPDLAIGIVHAGLGQQALEPGQAVGAAIAVVGIVEAEGREAVAAQRGLGPLAQPAQRQQQEAGGIGEGVPHRAQPGVAHLARAQQGARGVVGGAGGAGHGEAQAACASAWAAARVEMSRAAAWPETKPSSWKP